jgi:hypothetical protein
MRDWVWRELCERRAALGVPLVVPEVNMMAAASLSGFMGFNKDIDDGEALLLAV